MLLFLLLLLSFQLLGVKKSLGTKILLGPFEFAEYFVSKLKDTNLGFLEMLQINYFFLTFMVCVTVVVDGFTSKCTESRARPPLLYPG